MKDEVYTQCKLAKGNVIQVSYIPSVFAERGNKLMLKNAQDEWENGWIVVEVFQSLSKASVLTQERAHVRHRRTTDI